MIAPFEPPALLDRAVAYPRLDEIYAAQGDRPVKTHATVVATSHFDDVVERVGRAGVVHRVDQPTQFFAFPRLWLGRSSEQPARYVPTADAGLFVEVLPLPALGLPDPPGVDEVVATAECLTSYPFEDRLLGHAPSGV